MPVDIFPQMDIPVCSVVWTYAGMDALDIQNRILTLHERQMASLVDDIARIEATSYEGVGVEKVYLHEGADVTRAIAQLASSALVVLKYMPPNITPPLVIRYGATDVPIIQLSLVQQLAARHRAQRSGAEHHPPGARGGARRRGAVSVRRQAARHHGRPRPAGAAGARPHAAGRERRAADAERHPAGRRCEDRLHRLPRGHEQQPRRHRGDQLLPHQAGRRPRQYSCAMWRTCTTASRCRPTRCRWTACPAR